MMTKHQLRLFLESKMSPNLVKLISTKYYNKQNPYKDYHDKYKCIFVHIPKTAGKSILTVLLEQDSCGHIPVLDYRIFDRYKFETYFKFAFVRNPWDRFLSAYTYLKKGGISSYDKIWSKTYLSNYEDFESFVLDLQDITIAKKIIKGVHFRPQYDFVCDYKFNIKVNFIGKMENIDDDFEYVANKLGKIVKIPHLNKSVHKDYRDLYSHKMKQIVYNLYEKDIKIFGYYF